MNSEQISIAANTSGIKPAVPAYFPPRGDKQVGKKNDKLILSPAQRKRLEQDIKLAVYKNLLDTGLITRREYDRLCSLFTERREA